MAYEVSRRNFLKGAAAMTMAAAASTLLAGCSGNDLPDANTITLSNCSVKVTDAKTSDNSSIGSDKVTVYLSPVVSISYTGKGSLTLTYADMFDAELGDAKITLTNPIQPYNTTIGAITKCTPKFKITDKAVWQSYKEGKLPLKLKVTLDGNETAKFEIWNTGKITASKA